MILAIFGRSAAGKTTVAEIMASRLQLPVRHCGLAVRAAAIEAGAKLENIGIDVHKRIDRETLDWCDRCSTSGGIIEGRFLDSVLSGRSDVVLVSLFADETERSRRLSDRLGHAATPDEISAMDAADDAFRSVMYGSARDNESLALNTTGGTASLWAEKLEQYARQNMSVQLD